MPTENWTYFYNGSAMEFEAFKDRSSTLEDGVTSCGFEPESPIAVHLHDSTEEFKKWLMMIESPLLADIEILEVKRRQMLDLVPPGGNT